jgi:beta-ribofuranosylaminobenzene 5'-phosphate synthase
MLVRGHTDLRHGRTSFFREGDSGRRQRRSPSHGGALPWCAADLDALRSALATLNAVGFKAREIAFRGEPVKSLLGALLDRGYAASMSSMGPLVFAIFEADAAEREEELRSLCAHSGAKWLGVARGLNKSACLIRNTDR